MRWASLKVLVLLILLVLMNQGTFIYLYENYCYVTEFSSKLTKSHYSLSIFSNSLCAMLAHKLIESVQGTYALPVLSSHSFDKFEQ